MELTGNLKRHNSGYDICNVADEEVHFSRQMLEMHHPFSSSQPQSSGAGSRHPKLGATLSDSSNFSDINLNHHNVDSPTGGAKITAATTTNTNTTTTTISDEQAKSSRLLQSIGTRLRRSSSGFIRVHRLVGHYLLGITIQNWSEFLNTSLMMRAPTNRHQLSRRLVNNLNYFQGNYLCVSLLLVIYCILTSPLLLLAIMGYLFALYFVTVRSASGRPLLVLGLFKPSIQQQYSFITLFSLPLLWIAGAPSAVFWVIGASFVVVGLHAVMYCNEQNCAIGQADSSGYNQQRLDYGCPSLGAGAGGDPSSSYLSSSVQYYNHYSQMQPTNRYIQVSPTGNEQPAGQPAATSNFTSGYSLVNWVPFVGLNHKSPPAPPQHRAPDVMVISNDYAGLGRVYEV